MINNRPIELRQLIPLTPPYLSSLLFAPPLISSSQNLKPSIPALSSQKSRPFLRGELINSIMSLTIPTNLSKPLLKPKLSSSAFSTRVKQPLIVFSSSEQQKTTSDAASSLQAFSAALALSSILLSAPQPAVADISGLTPCKEAKQFAKREKQQLKKLESSLKLYAPDSAPALAIRATMEKTKKRFENYGKYGLLCGSDGLPHLIVSGDQRHWGEFVTPGLLFLYIAGWIGWVGRSYLIAIRDEKKPTQKEIIIDVPLASRLLFRGFSWPVAAYRELVNGELIDNTV